MLLKNGVCKLVAKVNDIDTSGFALKIKYETDKLDLEKKIFDRSRLVKKLDYKVKIIKIKNKIPSLVAQLQIMD